MSLSTQQLVAILLIVLLTFVNTRGLQLGKLIQNIFTSAKTLSLLALIVLGMFVGRNADAIAANFATSGRRAWCPRSSPTCRSSRRCRPRRCARAADRRLCRAGRLAVFRGRLEQHHVYRRRGEDPRRNVPLSLAFGTGLVIALYLLANVAYLCALPLDSNPARAGRPRRHGRAAK